MRYSVGNPQNGGGKKIGKGMWIAVAVLIVLAALSPVLSSLKQEDSTPQGDGSPQDFSAEGLTITLTNDFATEDADGYTFCFDSEQVAVLGLKEEFALQEGAEDYTLEEYGALVIESNGLDAALEQRDGILCFTYEYAADKDATYFYLVTLFKTDDAFWMVQFISLTEDAEALQPTFVEWAKSITFE